MLKDERPRRYCQTTVSDGEHDHDSRIAKAAVKEVFAILGVDVDNPEKVEEFRKDLRFGGAMRRATDRGVTSMVGVVVAVLMAAIGLGISALINANRIGGHGL